MLSEELKRYNRQMILPEIGLPGQEKLKAAKILMIGAGGLGCPALLYLAAAGVGTIGIIDDDKVDISNLHRQILYSSNDIGKPKAILAKEKLELLNSHIVINAYDERFTTINGTDILDKYDLIIDGSDNFETRYLINDLCILLNKTLVYGSIFKFEGYVSVFNYLGGPSYRDVFPESPDPSEVPNCSEIGVVGVLPGIIGSYMANEAIKIICGIGETLSGKLMTINALDNATTIFKIGKNRKQHLSIDSAIKLKAQETPLVNEIDKLELTTWLQQSPEETYLVDVREPFEYEDFNIGGFNIPLNDLINQIEFLPLQKKIVFCCQTGQRSKMAIHILKPIFRGTMYSLKNGITG